MEPRGIIIKSPEEVAIMRKAGRIVALILESLAKALGPGMGTRELDVIAEKELAKHGAVSSFLGYRGFPSRLCVSVNDEVVHGIPGDRVINTGDIVSLDMGAIYEGFQGDAAMTVGVGDISPQAGRLLAATREALAAGIAACRVGARLGDVSSAIQLCAESRGFSVVREYTGHGIGRDMHEEPQVPNFGLSGHGPTLRRGMTVALEPMVNAGSWQTKVGDNNWTVSTSDGSLSAHFEHTVAITDGEPEVLTVL
jgi:methionyl aminopeptidase